MRAAPLAAAGPGVVWQSVAGRQGAARLTEGRTMTLTTDRKTLTAEQQADLRAQDYLKWTERPPLDLRGFNLEGADLRGAYLKGANLGAARLVGANVSEANLDGVDFQDADLDEVKAVKTSFRMASFRNTTARRANFDSAVFDGALLLGCRFTRAYLVAASFDWATLFGSDFSESDFQLATGFDTAQLKATCLDGAKPPLTLVVDSVKVDRLHQRVYEAARQEGALDMREWHGKCGTSHCRAGWVTSLAGPQGSVLEALFGTSVAASIIYKASDPGLLKLPQFFDVPNEVALEDMRLCAEREAEREGGR